MKERDEKRSKKLRNLIILSFLCALVLGVSTYAWFIGMKTVNVSTFDVKVATTEGLYISLDGESWAYNLDLNTAKDTAYENNTNRIDGVELIPVSTIGDMDATASTMIMYEKGSLNAYDGGNGYRLLASRVRNYPGVDDNGKTYTLSAINTGIENPDVSKTGYLVFDLFIKNVSGEEYYVENNPANEEAIYLTTNSKVVASGKTGTGIENSVRVAFAQIGRVEDVKENYGDARATSVTCSDVGFTYSVVDGKNVAVLNSGVNTRQTVTGICRPASIWEPNDLDHEQNAINWYTTSVSNNDSLKRSLEDGHYFTTSAVKKEIVTGDTVNIYDTEATKGNFLKDYDYFTDSEKNLKGTDRQAFMSLAPNSITKVRVYVYLEGQDIDNYDFASLGEQITVNFGFTKERFQETDIDYSGPTTYITPTDSAAIENTNGTEIEEGKENSYYGQNNNDVETPSIPNAYR